MKLNESEVNTLIAALLLAAVRYDGKEDKHEAAKYRELEYKFRELCYEGELVYPIEISKLY